MTRSGYTEGIDSWDLIRWRGAVASAIGGKRGQAFLREMNDALEAMPEKRLLSSVLVGPKGCCAMGAVAIHRGMDTAKIDPFISQRVADSFGIAPAMAKEIAYYNDEFFYGREEEPEARYKRMKLWVEGHLAERAKPSTRGDDDGKS